MPAVHADPEKMKEFAKQLGRSADKLQEVARELSRALDRSGWQDAERQKFEQDFKQTLKSLSRMAGPYDQTVGRECGDFAVIPAVPYIHVQRGGVRRA